jgi:hypothetical protein
MPASASDNGKQQEGGGMYANLTAVWWQWVYAQPAIDVNGTNTNPVLDRSGAYAGVGQENGIGPGNRIFFLTGTFGGDVVRHVTVPEGKTLFFPVLNFEADNAVAPPTNYTVPQLRAIAKANIDSATATYARLNGEDLEIARVKSPTFDYELPDENSVYDYFGLLGPQFEGRVQPVVSDGYWVSIPPLPAGQYVLEFGGANSGGFSLHVVYNLTVE